MADDEHEALFVYGTLMFDAVLVTLLKRLPESRPARLKGYRRFAIRDRVYPAIIPAADCSVCGLVLLGLTAKERRILDEFEDEDYIKTPLTVQFDAALAHAMGTGTGTGAGTSVGVAAGSRPSVCATTACAEDAQRDSEVSATVETVADVYVWRAEFADELEGDWDAAAFGQARGSKPDGRQGGSGDGSSACSREGKGYIHGGGDGDELTRYVAMCRQWVEADYGWGQVE